MRKFSLFILWVTGVCAALAFAQTLPSTVPSPHNLGFRGVDQSQSDVVERTFHLEGKEYRSLMTWKEAESGRAWDSTSPLPISLQTAEEIARRELIKLVSDDVRWQFSEFCIGHFRRPGAKGENWYFALTMKPVLALGEVNADSFTVLMSSSGVPGRIGRVAGSAQ